MHGVEFPGIRLGVLGLALASVLAGGCASITNPVVDGIPVRRLPPEFLGLPREEQREIPLTLLRQKPPSNGRLRSISALPCSFRKTMSATLTYGWRCTGGSPHWKTAPT